MSRKTRTGKIYRKHIITWHKVMTADEQQLLFDYLNKQIENNPDSIAAERDLMICDLFLRTGIRNTELCKLRVQDTPMCLGVDFIEIYRGKNDKDRTVPVSKRLARDLTNYIKTVRGKTLPRYINREDMKKPVFYSQARRQYNRVALQRKITRLCQRAGITKHITPHKFRHTCATRSLLTGVDVYRLQRILGHSEVKTTMEYVHFTANIMDGIGEKLDQPIRPVSGVQQQFIYGGLA